MLGAGQAITPVLEAQGIYLAMIIVMKIVIVILGYLTIRLGYNLISAGAKGEFHFTAALGKLNAGLASVSPGLLFVLLGIGLNCYALFVNKPISVSLKSQPAESVKRPMYLPLPEPELHRLESKDEKH